MSHRQEDNRVDIDVSGMEPRVFGRHITSSGVAPCPCCGEDIMVDDVAVLELCEECSLAECVDLEPCRAESGAR